MTGEKNRYKPLDTLLKLDDEQLKTPKHDEMVLWLLNEENIKKTLPDVFKKYSEMAQERIKELATDYARISQDIEEVNKEIQYHYLTKNEWLKMKNGELESLKYHEKCLKKPKITIISERPIKAQNGFLIGYWDIALRISGLQYTIYIEVKPKITSFGATLRQLRTYESYANRKDKIYLFTEDLRFKDAFESQGIRVISPPTRQTSLTEGGIND